MIRGAGVIAAVKATAMRNSGSGNTFQLIINPGETVPIRVFGEFEDKTSPMAMPIYSLSHWLPFNKTFQKCAYELVNDEAGNVVHKLFDGHKGCAFHKLDREQGGNVGVDATWWVQDLRKTHKFDQDVQYRRMNKFGQLELITNKYPPCTAPNCQWCRMGNEAGIGPWRSFRISAVQADVWLAQRQAIRALCRSCGQLNEEGQGTIYVYGYLCGNCGQQIGYDPSYGPTVICTNCTHETRPTEWLGCSTCNNAERSDMSDVIWDVTVTLGAGKAGKQKRNWSFIPRLYPRRSLDASEIEAAMKYMPNWDEEIKPDSLEMQLLQVPPDLQQAVLDMLGVKRGENLAPPGHGAVPYGQAALPPARGQQQSLWVPQQQQLDEAIVEPTETYQSRVTNPNAGRTSFAQPWAPPQDPRKVEVPTFGNIQTNRSLVAPAGRRTITIRRQ